MNIIRQHVPNFIDAEPQTLSFEHVSELDSMDDPFIKRFASMDSFNYFIIEDEFLKMNLELEWDENGARDIVAGWIVESDENLNELLNFKGPER